MKTRQRAPRAAFVVTFSLLATGACGKQDGSGKTFECKPPDCHMNPPPQNPPLIPDAGAATPASASAPVAK